MHPFFSAGDLDDEALGQKIMELQQRLIAAHMISGNPQIMDQLGLLLETLEAERQERGARELQRMWSSQFPDVIESDPEFRKDTTKDSDSTTGGSTKKFDRSKVQPAFNKTYRKPR